MATSGNDTIPGSTGNDTIDALAGDDTISPLTGNDIVNGGTGSDVLQIDYSGNAYAGPARSTGIIFTVYDSVNGNGAFFAHKDDAGASDSVGFSSIERFNITGTPQGDYLIDPLGGMIDGLAGNSTLNGGGGTDTLAADLSVLASNQVITPSAAGSGTLPDGTIYTGMEVYNLITGAGNDSIAIAGTGAFNDTLVTGDGNDTISGGLGNDGVGGGAGSDLLIADYSGNAYAGPTKTPGITFTVYDSVNGNGAFFAHKDDAGASDSVGFSGIERFNFTGTPQGDFLIDPLGGMIDGLAGNSTLAGGAGTDTLAADLSVLAANQVIATSIAGSGTLPDGTIYTGMEVYNLSTGAGNDSIMIAVTGAFNDTLVTGDGNDTISGGLGNDGVGGGAGSDLLVVNYSGNTYAGTVRVPGITFTVYDSVNGNGAFFAHKNDAGASDSVGFSGIERFNFTGTPQGDFLIDPLGGMIDGLAGNSTLNGGLGTDTLSADLSVLAINQVITPSASGSGTLPDGTIYSGLEVYRLTTGDGNDSIAVTRVFDDSFFTGNGNDTINGGLGNDVVNGGAGTDLLVVNYSGNTYAGPTRTPGIIFSSYDSVNGNGGFFAHKNDAGATDSVGFSGIERFNITGTPQGDFLIDPLGGMIDGLAGNSTLAGGAGTDTLLADLSVLSTPQVITESVAGSGTLPDGTIYSGMEVYRLTTGAGNDSIAVTRVFDDSFSTGDGNDTISGGLGNDAVNGGAGTDLLVVDYSGNTYAGPTRTPGIIFNSYDPVAGSGSFYAHKNDAGGTDSVGFSGIERFNITGTPQNDYLIDPAGGNSTLAGGAGADTLVANLASIGTNQTIGPSSTLADGTVYSGIELFNLTTGGGNDSIVLTGAFNDTLSTGAGNDTVNAGQGKDGINADLGSDVLVADYSGNAYAGGAHTPGIQFTSLDTVNGNGGFFAYKSDTDFDSVSFSGVERLQITGTAAGDNLLGGASGDTLNGSGGNDTFTSGAGNDSLSGGSGDDSFNGGVGVDKLAGGAGNDTYVMNGDGDSIVENLSEGTDLVQSSVSFTLGANLENLTLTGVSAINGTGNGLNNVLTGNTAANILNGSTGNDTMAGGAGNDTYIVGGVGDVVTEAASEGSDLVQSSVSFALASDIEKLTLTGAAAINGTGNSLGNTLTGNTAGNILDGLAGNDTMSGGAGNDTYVVDSTGDITAEGASAGTDLVQSSVSRTLAANAENLILTGAAAINGTGNGLNNVLTGNTAANILNGSTGNDTMAGGAGNDTYIVGGVGDVVTEAASEGSDLVQSSVSFALASDIEKLTLTGTAAINGTGNSLANALTGNTAANILNGSTGNDTMAGGAGNDTYVVDSAGDITTEGASAGTDLVQSSVSRTLSVNVENLTLTGVAAINGTGNGLDNVLTGNTAANILNGSTGNDTMAGGAGNDTYVVGSAGDVVTEAASAGTDLVQSSVSLVLGANIEKLTLTGTAVINGTGNSLDNTLIGNAGNNILDGTGALLGVGERDTLTGGTGADVFVLGSAASRYYDDGSGASSGTGDYAYVSDLTPSQGDKLQLKGTSADYLLGTNPVGGLTGTGVFFDTNGDLLLGATDELVAVVNNTAVSLTLDANYV